MIRFTHDGRYVESSRIEVDGPTPAPGGLDGRRFHELLFRAAGPAALAATADARSTPASSRPSTSRSTCRAARASSRRGSPRAGADEVTAIVRDFTTQRTAEAELRRSRARIVEAADAERRRLERDLHDGAQQRLVSLSLALRLLRSRLAASGGADPEALAAADEAAAQVKLAIRELRELARGIHPAILTEAGLGPAITALAERSAVPASVETLPGPPAAAGRRGDRLLRGVGGPRERRQVRVGDLGERRRGLRRGHAAGRGRRRRRRRGRPEPAARGSAACRTGSRRWAGG